MRSSGGSLRKENGRLGRASISRRDIDLPRTSNIVFATTGIGLTRHASYAYHKSKFVSVRSRRLDRNDESLFEVMQRAKKEEKEKSARLTYDRNL